MASVTKGCISSQAKLLSLGLKSTPFRNRANAPCSRPFRLHSSITGRCPHRGSDAQAVSHHESATESTNSQVQFIDVPKLPVFGSFIQRYSNAVPYTADTVYDFWFNGRKKFGDFYCLGMPALGKGITGDSK